MSAAANEIAAGIETEAGGKITESEMLQGEGEGIRSAPPTSKLNVLRAAILMPADSMLADLQAIRGAKTLEEAQAAVNLMIDRVMALNQVAEVAAEKDRFWREADIHLGMDEFSWNLVRPS